MYLVVIGILSIVLAFPRPVYRLLTDPSAVMAAVALVSLLPPLAGLLAARRTLRLIEKRVDDPGEGQFAFARGMMAAHALLLAGHGSLLLLTDWIRICLRTPVVGEWPVIGSLLALTPFLLSVLLLWVAAYPADRVVRQIAVEVYLLRSKPVRPVWSLGQYVVYNLRHQVLFVLAPMILILLARDIIAANESYLRKFSRQGYLSDLLLGAAAVVVALCAPVILRYVWVTSRLPDGPLRDKLLLLCAKLRLKCREILIWRSGGMVVNAAVMGVVPPLRYVLLTDAMLEQLDDTKIEAVFGHEAGHIKRHHILVFLLFALISGCATTVFSVRTHRVDPLTYQLAAAGLGLLLAFKWGVLFGWISRRFERQADIYGVRTLALAGVPCSQPCALHQSDTPVSAALKSERLCSTAAHIFGDTLNTVAVLNGIPPEAPSWRHSSIASRSRFVQALARDPALAARFERRLLWIKLAVFIVATGSSAWAAWELKLWELVGIRL
ncbi:Protease HtpX [Phycisphaerae bacterium RAS1]|nr:Protease HtpX [Phycisphaerae bacterium RAS1]